ncbi:HlyD family secretion protein [Roseibium sp. RKSG952]|uniref:HlyD family secretion protein n=1 Tax=Roseibium sp. RKSG952 TaxID=2529384 RepID=UPI0012BB7019|nr:HlyD family secretion protein [Roseibium sp. RKSG952]MTH97640.1 HlyD family secretion protein [Roseibium sp. RKSG952]
MFERKLIILFVLVVFGLFLANEISRLFFAYSSDAFVVSDHARISPTVPGLLVELHVVNDTDVTKGTPLFTLDQTPYKLAVESAEANKAVAEQALKVAKDAVAEAAASIKSAQAVLRDTEATQARIAALKQKGFSTQQALDDANRNLTEARAEYESAVAAQNSAQDQLAQRIAQMRDAQATLATAQYNLEQTVVRAPFDGQVVPFSTKAGQYLNAGDIAMVLVAGDAYRLVANVHEQHIQYIRPGQPVYYMVSTVPWRIFKGKVRGVSRGISRSPTQQIALPYIDPDTGWIRLSQRFPIDIDLAPDAGDNQKFMGSDARVLILNRSPEPAVSGSAGAAR